MQTDECLDCGEVFNKKYDYMVRCFPCYKKIHPKTKCVRCLNCHKIKFNLETLCFDCWILSASPTMDITNCKDCGKDLKKKGTLNDHYLTRCYDCHINSKMKPLQFELLRFYENLKN